MRGNLRAIFIAIPPRRSIPAHAGQPLNGRGAASPMPVYPRACGATCTPSSSICRWNGLSPRMRGNRHIQDMDIARGRSIPAHAGQPRRRVSRRRRVRVYPRACGATVLLSRYPSESVGLSPRMRGNLKGSPNEAANQRSIPAHAGQPHTRTPGD